MMRCAEPLLDGPVGAVLLDDLGRLHVGEHVEQRLQRVVGRLVAGGRRRS